MTVTVVSSNRLESRIGRGPDQLHMSTLETIRIILEQKKFSDFVGLKEDLWFDAKARPGYDFTQPSGRIELAKDVSGFANGSGGYLVIGLKTSIVLEERSETVTAVDLVRRADFDAIQILGLIREHVYPELPGLTVDWVESPSGSDLGLGVIWVPPQDQGKKFFLMTRVIEDGHQFKQIVFGIAQRLSSSTEPVSTKRLYDITQRGNSEASQRMTRIEGKLDSVLHAFSQEKSRELQMPEDVETKIKKLLES